MNKKVLFYSITLLFGCLFTSCDQAKKETAVSTETEKDTFSPAPNSPLGLEYLSLKQQVDSTWVALDKVEKDKIFVIKRLIQEISFNPSHKSSALKEGLKKVEDLESKKLTPSSLHNLENMDQYDVLSDDVITTIIIIKEETPNMEKYPLADDLLSDLDSLNGNAVISKRGDYGRAVVEYNKFIKQNYEELKKSGVENLDLIPGLFPDEEATSSDKNL